ncbi:PQ loop repeat protein [Patellaria atrata CBS 101060]|uniref:PQ loop repeat protein n=1 Tax=Patellaria atrata CBS 101060 TaxID=1346257 RepID=A0A9P4SJM2_9PEZI|nr:PQ loop repeat protein [Patellaria atrata CBS 101060]
MAPQENIPLSANILGYVDLLMLPSLLLIISAVCWCVQIIPQIWYNWHRKDTEGLPGMMLFLWAAGTVPLGAYAVVQNFNIPIQIQPQVFGALTMICWAQTLIYHNRWRVWTASLFVTAVAILFAGAEAILILTLRGPYSRGISWPVTMVGIISAVVLAAGLIPPYFELWKRSGRVIGINFVFLTIDFAGGFFSLMALVAQQTFDYLGGVQYIICLILEIGIFGSHWIWLYRTRTIRKEAKSVSKSYDEYVGEKEGKVKNESLDVDLEKGMTEKRLSIETKSTSSV